MKVNSIFTLVIFFLSTVLSGCQSMEDTYEQYSGNGKIRYVGKCEEFTVTAGWKRFVLNWAKSPDPTIKQIKIVWKSDKGEGSKIVSADQTSYETDAVFEDLPYTFECYGVDGKGNLSLPSTLYARPFTETHELVIGFPKMISKYFFLGDNLIIFLDTYLAGMKSTTITYYQGGVEKTIEITKNMFDAKFLHLTGVDTGKDVVVNRRAEVEGCIDPVTFEPYRLERSQFFMNLDLAQQLKDRYNLEEITAEFVRSQETIEVDYSINSLEDILCFPNLRKVILGSNRFMVQNAGDPMILSKLRDYEASVYAFKKMRDILNIDVEIHNNHFDLIQYLDFAVAKGNPSLPVLDYLDMAGWKVTSSTKEGTGDIDLAGPERILDNDAATLWAPENVQNIIRTHELTIDMQAVKTLHGFKITQALQNTIVQTYYPDIIHIQVSNDNYTWEEAFYQIQSNIGLNYGESTVLYMPEQKDVRYIRIILADKITSLRNNTCLGDFIPF